MSNKRRIAIVTGKRGGFGAMLGLMKLIDEDPDMELILIVTDMHLSSFFGYTAKEVEKFFKISYKLELEQEDDSCVERSLALGRCLTKMTNILSQARPDLLITLGDRGEVLSACIAAMELNIPIAHILGGDVAGNRDGNRIHAITKLAHLHFPSSKDSLKRILKLGEEPWRVFNVGATYVDYIVQQRYNPPDEVLKRYGIENSENYFICIQHPMTLQEGTSYEEAFELLSALKKKGTKTLVVYPCSDQGYLGTISAIDKFRNEAIFSIHKNIEALDFWSLMSRATLFIGNSSAGLMETPYFNLPTVNVGHRQNGRVRDTNVIDVNPDMGSIIKGIEKGISNKFRETIVNHKIFGNGTAGSKIYNIIKNLNIDEKLIMKKITY